MRGEDVTSRQAIICVCGSMEYLAAAGQAIMCLLSTMFPAHCVMHGLSYLFGMVSTVRRMQVVSQYISV